MAFGNATKGYVKKHSGGGGGGGTTNYSELSNKPQINGITLDGNKTSEDLNIGGGGGFSNLTLLLDNAGSVTFEELPTNGIIFIFGSNSASGSFKDIYNATTQFVPTPLLELISNYNFNINNNPFFALKDFGGRTYSATIQKSNNTYTLTISGSQTVKAYGV